MNRKVCVLFTILLLMGLPSFLEAQTEGYSARPRSVRLPWPGDDNAWRYEVLIEADIEGAYREHLKELTQEFFVIVSLLPGKYRYRVIPYDYLGHPETELASAWRSFEIPALASSPQADGLNLSQGTAESSFLPESEDTSALWEWEYDEPISLPGSGNTIVQPESDEPAAQLKAEKSISARDNEHEAASLWTAGVSLGTSFYRPWLIVTLHMTTVPLPYSFLEIGADIGLVSGDSDGQYYSMYPFAHYAFFTPFPKTAGRQSGGWYIGAGGGYWISVYSYPEGTIEESKFVADFIVGLNIFNMFDISYTLRTDFTGVSGKLSAGFVYRF
jgi:hypothetical protein